MMTRQRLIRFGGMAFICSGLLFLAQYLFLRSVPAPPLEDAALLSWLSEWRFQLSMADEVLFFAAVLLIPSIAALYRLLVQVNPVLTEFGCGLLAVSVPVYIVLVIILGRLVYPVYGIELTPESYRLIISFYYGGVHCVALVVGIATILLSLVIWKSGLGQFTAALGLLTGVFDLIGSYPWLLGEGMILISQLLFSGWLVILGVNMRMSATRGTD
ncbi:hypothetical protein MKZ07_27590 [Paenibacillus sp. FSL P4-0338]|uniref:hypothetical protein n=1 Tax=unclassified Paenibacillus TaxID=185978 RepID=UPI0004AEAE01|nr:hypothetical protein [Paenibacillus sp. FSL R7-269]